LWLDRTYGYDATRGLKLNLVSGLDAGSTAHAGRDDKFDIVFENQGHDALSL
jgi:hypothetical protein